MFFNLVLSFLDFFFVEWVLFLLVKIFEKVFENGKLFFFMGVFFFWLFGVLEVMWFKVFFIFSWNCRIVSLFFKSFIKLFLESFEVGLRLLGVLFLFWVCNIVLLRYLYFYNK